MIAISAATQGVLDRQTALALKPALDQIGEVLEEVKSFCPPRICKVGQGYSGADKRLSAGMLPCSLRKDKTNCQIICKHICIEQLVGALLAAEIVLQSKAQFLELGKQLGRACRVYYCCLSHTSTP